MAMHVGRNFCCEVNLLALKAVMHLALVLKPEFN